MILYYLLLIDLAVFNNWISAIVNGFRKKVTMVVLRCIPVPAYLSNWQDSGKLVLALCLVPPAWKIF